MKAEVLGRVCPILCCATIALGQSPAVRPSFEVSSVKPALAGSPGPGPLQGGPGTSDPGRLAGRASLMALIVRAWDVKNYQVRGPDWMDSARYDVQARIPPGATKADIPLMLQAMLAEQFHLAVHIEMREQPVYLLRVTKGGPRLQSAKARGADAAGFVPPRMIAGPDGFPDLAPGSDVTRSFETVIGGSDGLLYKVWARDESMEKLADRLSSHLDRPVIDETRISGNFDFSLAWGVESVGGRIPHTNPPPDEIDSHSTPVLGDGSVSIFAALPAQTGLRLEPAKRRIRMIFVDHAERIPTGN